METIKSLLDDVKTAKGIESKYALAKVLGVPTQRISDYYNGTGSRTPDEFACLQIAQALGRSYEEISAIVRIEAEKDESRRKVWREYYKSIGGYAASIMMLVSLVTLIVTWPTDAVAKSMSYEAQVSRIQIMRLWLAVKKAIAAVQRTFSIFARPAYFAG